MIGTQVGSWVLQKLLGAGGMGRVYLAQHVVMHDSWAVKILADELTQRPDVVARFVNEARAAAKVRHRNLIRVFQIDQVPNGPWYMVLEYLEGSTLAAFMTSRGGPVPYEEIVRHLSQVANALEVLHAVDIVHRDLKPDNVFLVRRDDDRKRPILLDLGVASLGALAMGTVTQRGTVLGTPCYMAPEQLLGEAVRGTADVYALGVIAYEMSTGGWMPYQQDGESRETYVNLSPAELYRRQSLGPPVDPRRRNPGISDAWARVLFRLLETDPTQRIGTAKAAALALGKAMPVIASTGVDGLEIVRRYARELIQADNLLETLRAPGQAVITPAGSGAESRYSLGHKIGAGGMAEVFIGTQHGEQGFERKVAIKRVLAELSVQPGFAAMFISEARIASRLGHSNIVSVIDFRSDAEGRLFLVMEYVQGKDLAALLEAGPLPPSTIIHIVIDVLRGLGYAHTRVDEVTGTRGVVHRDVSPQNVLISYEGDAKINDFGLARVRDGGGWAGSSKIAGKPSYMSPEQVRGEPLDNRSDLWAVGVMLHEMLTHQPMFTGSIMEVMGQVQFSTLRRPSSMRAGVPADLEAVTMRLLERDVNARYGSAEQVISDLARCADASMNGRAELVAHLAARFGGVSHRGSTDLAGLVRAPHSERITHTAAAIPSTLGSAASQSAPALPPPRRRRSALRWLAPMLVLASAIVGVAIGTRGARTTSPAVAVARDAGGDAQGTTPLVVLVVPDAAVVAAVAPAPSDAPVHIDARPPVDAAAPIDARPDASIPVDASTPDAPVADAGTRASVAPLVAEPARPATPSAKPSDASTSSVTKHQAEAHISAPRPIAPMGELGELVILVKPWATVSINNKQVGATPFRKKVPSGKYVVRLSNDELGKTETATIIVEPNKTTTLGRTW